MASDPIYEISVASESEAGVTYQVKGMRPGNVWWCSCPSYRFSKTRQPCKHIRKAEALLGQCRRWVAVTGQLHMKYRDVVGNDYDARLALRAFIAAWGRHDDDAPMPSGRRSFDFDGEG